MFHQSSFPVFRPSLNILILHKFTFLLFFFLLRRYIINFEYNYKQGNLPPKHWVWRKNTLWKNFLESAQLLQVLYYNNFDYCT